MYTIRVSDGVDKAVSYTHLDVYKRQVDKVIAKWKKSNPNLFKKYKLSLIHI